MNKWFGKLLRSEAHCSHGITTLKLTYYSRFLNHGDGTDRLLFVDKAQHATDQNERTDQNEQLANIYTYTFRDQCCSVQEHGPVNLKAGARHIYD